MCRHMQLFRVMGSVETKWFWMCGLVAKGFLSEFVSRVLVFGLRLACFGLRRGCRVRRGKHSRYKPPGVGHRLGFSKGNRFFYRNSYGAVWKDSHALKLPLISLYILQILQ